MASKKKKWTREEQALHRRMWLAALRSGDYKQTTMTLRDEDGFCCLGVACDVYLNSGDAPKSAKWLKTNEFQPKKSDIKTGVLPETVKDWLGLKDEAGEFYVRTKKADWTTFSIDGKKYTQESLAEINDNGKTFKQIAKIIENEPKGLLADDVD